MDTRGLIRECQEETSIAYCSRCQNGLPRISRPQEQTIWPRAPVGGADQDYVLGPVFLHHGQAKEGGTGIQGSTQMRHHRVSSTSGRGPLVESSGGAVARPPKKWLPPLPPPHRSPTLGE